MMNVSVKHLVPGKCATLSTSDVDLSLSGMGAFHACHCACGDLIRQPFRQRHLAECAVVAPEPFTVRVLTIQCVCPSPPCFGFCGVAFTKHAETFRRTISRRSAAQVQRRRDKRCPLLTRRGQVKRCFRDRLGAHIACWRCVGHEVGRQQSCCDCKMNFHGSLDHEKYVCIAGRAIDQPRLSFPYGYSACQWSPLDLVISTHNILI
jgi:hypothetical protein